MPPTTRTINRFCVLAAVADRDRADRPSAPSASPQVADLLADRPGGAGQDCVRGREDLREQARQHRDPGIDPCRVCSFSSSVTVSWPHTGGNRYFAATWNSSSETFATENRGAASSASLRVGNRSSLVPATTRVMSSAPSCIRLSTSGLSALFPYRGSRSAVRLNRLTPTGIA